MAVQADPSPTIRRRSTPGVPDVTVLERWAALDIDLDGFEPNHPAPPTPAFVQLSRLVDPRLDGPSVHLVTDCGSTLTSRRPSSVGDDGRVSSGFAGVPRWADSVGRPLFQVGLAAMVAAGAVALSALGDDPAALSTIEGTPDQTTTATLNHGKADDGFTADTPPALLDPGSTDVVDHDRARDVLEALVRADQADLAIIGTATAQGDRIVWTATIRNEGPANAAGPISLVHTIGSEIEVLSTTENGWSCEHLRQAGSITCRLDADLPAGQRRRLTVVTDNGEAEPGARIPSTMSVVASTSDPDLGNNTINVSAVSGPFPGEGRSSGSTDDGSVASTEGEADDSGQNRRSTGTVDQAGSSEPMTELPKTGNGLTAALAATGAVLCVTGRRLLTWRSRAETRAALAAADIR